MLGWIKHLITNNLNGLFLIKYILTFLVSTFCVLTIIVNIYNFDTETKLYLVYEAICLESAY